MGLVTDFSDKFEQYIHEPEGFSLRSERLAAEFPGVEPRRLLAWLRAAYMQGVRDSAQDAVTTLRGYSTATVGSLDLCTAAAGYDAAADGLMVYFTKALDNAEKGAS